MRYHHCCQLLSYQESRGGQAALADPHQQPGHLEGLYSFQPHYCCVPMLALEQYKRDHFYSSGLFGSNFDIIQLGGKK